MMHQGERNSFEITQRIGLQINVHRFSSNNNAINTTGQHGYEVTTNATINDMHRVTALVN